MRPPPPPSAHHSTSAVAIYGSHTAPRRTDREREGRCICIPTKAFFFFHLLVLDPSFLVFFPSSDPRARAAAALLYSRWAFSHACSRE